MKIVTAGTSHVRIQERDDKKNNAKGNARGNVKDHVKTKARNYRNRKLKGEALSQGYR